MIAVRAEQFENVKSPILVTPLPITALTKLVHSVNALSPMLVTLLGIVMLVRAAQ